MAKIKSETANADCACIVELKHQDLKVSDQLTHCTAVLMDIVHYPMYMWFTQTSENYAIPLFEAIAIIETFLLNIRKIFHMTSIFGINDTLPCAFLL